MNVFTSVSCSHGMEHVMPRSFFCELSDGLIEQIKEMAKMVNDNQFDYIVVTNGHGYWSDCSVRAKEENSGLSFLKSELPLVQSKEKLVKNTGFQTEEQQLFVTSQSFWFECYADRDMGNDTKLVTKKIDIDLITGDHVLLVVY